MKYGMSGVNCGVERLAVNRRAILPAVDLNKLMMNERCYSHQKLEHIPILRAPDVGYEICHSECDAPNFIYFLLQNTTRGPKRTGNHESQRAKQ